MEQLNLEGYNYSQALARLETIVKEMESDSCSIDDLSSYTSQALQLLKFCKDRLHKTDTEVKQCLAELKQTFEGQA